MGPLSRETYEESSMIRRCPCCPTEYEFSVEMVPGAETCPLTIVSWKDLGRGLNYMSEPWKFMCA